MRASARGVIVAIVAASATKSTSTRRRRRCSSTKRAPIVSSLPARRVSARASSCARSARNRHERRAAGNRHQGLRPNRFAARFDAAFVVADTGPAETRLDEVVRGDRREADRQRPLPADQYPRRRRPQIVVGDAGGYAAQMRKRADMAVEKADLILPLVDPRKVATGVHQTQDEEPLLLSLATEIDEHFEEIDLGQSAGAIGQRNHDFAPLPLPLRDGRFHDRDADRNRVCSAFVMASLSGATQNKRAEVVTQVLGASQENLPVGFRPTVGRPKVRTADRTAPAMFGCVGRVTPGLRGTGSIPHGNRPLLEGEFPRVAAV